MHLYVAYEDFKDVCSAIHGMGNYQRSDGPNLDIFGGPGTLDLVTLTDTESDKVIRIIQSYTSSPIQALLHQYSTVFMNYTDTACWI